MADPARPNEVDPASPFSSEQGDTPVIETVEIATEGEDPVAVRQGKIMAATFHPELSQDTRIHQAFLDLVSNGGNGPQR